LPDLAQESKLKATVEAAIATGAMDFFAGLKEAAISFTLDVTLHARLGLGTRCFAALSFAMLQSFIATT